MFLYNRQRKTSAAAILLPGMLISAAAFAQSPTPDSLTSVLELLEKKEAKKQAVAALDEGRYRLAVAPPIELDGIGVGQFIELRKQYVNSRADLFRALCPAGSSHSKADPPWWYRLFRRPAPQVSVDQDCSTYEPAKTVFGKIIGGRPWWGMLGLYHYGPGRRAPVGPSADARFICNPFLLVGLAEPGAVTITDEQVKPQSPFPLASSISIDTKSLRETINYRLSSFLTWQSYFTEPDHPNQGRLKLVAINARDFGFNYLYIDPAASKNIESLNHSGQALAIRQGIHFGVSCGYQGGCNQLGPERSSFALKVIRLPAQARVRLWRKAPDNVSDPADFTVLLNLVE